MAVLLLFRRMPAKVEVPVLVIAPEEMVPVTVRFPPNVSS
jgi:hypothetical protein